MARATRGSVKDERSWWTQRWFVASGALFAALVLLGLYTAAGGGGASSPAPPAAAAPTGRAAPPLRSSASSGSAAVARVGAAPQGCSLPAGAQAEPTTAPQASWELVGSMAAPSAPSTVGPQHVVDGVRECFAHSPAGALFAAVNFWAQGTAQPEAVLYRALAADTPQRSAAIVDGEKNPSERLDTMTKLQVAGFAITAYTPQTAAVTLVFQVANGAYASVPSTMRWERGDWRYVISPEGLPGAGQIADLSGYVAWSGA